MSPYKEYRCSPCTHTRLHNTKKRNVPPSVLLYSVRAFLATGGGGAGRGGPEAGADLLGDSCSTCTATGGGAAGENTGPRDDEEAPASAEPPAAREEALIDERGL